MPGRSNRAKGMKFEREVRGFLAANGLSVLKPAEGVDDKCEPDILVYTGRGAVALQCKDTVRSEPGVWFRDAAAQAAAFECRAYAVVLHRRGASRDPAEFLVLTPLSQLVELLRDGPVRGDRPVDS